MSSKKVDGEIWPKLLFFLFALFIVNTQTTDADLLDQELISDNSFKATTLNFSNRQTANNLQLSSLFNVIGMVPGGFQVESIRVKQDGKMSFNYQVTSTFSPGDAGLCDQLQIKILKNFTSIYDGPLKDFVSNSYLGQDTADDLVMFISFNDQNTYFTNKTCNFNFVFQSVEENTGFIDQEIVQNQISTGTWSN